MAGLATSLVAMIGDISCPPPIRLHTGLAIAAIPRLRRRRRRLFPSRNRVAPGCGAQALRGALRALGNEPDLDLTGQLGSVSTCHCGLISQLNTTRSGGS